MTRILIVSSTVYALVDQLIFFLEVKMVKPFSNWIFFPEWADLATFIDSHTGEGSELIVFLI